LKKRKLPHKPRDPLNEKRKPPHKPRDPLNEKGRPLNEKQQHLPDPCRQETRPWHSKKDR